MGIKKMLVSASAPVNEKLIKAIFRLNPKSLIKNIPNKKEMWKAPVKAWIRDMYEDRKRKSEQKAKRKNQNN